MTAFEWLYDGIPEDGIEEHAWLRADLAATPEEAAAKMTELYERDAGPLEDLRPHVDAPAPVFRTAGRTFMRAELIVTDEDDESGDCEVATLYGAAAERCASENGIDDELRYVTCEPDDDDAIEWWKVELADGAAA